ncbi:MAG: dependent oxidoreductase [Conexibacter sp.]|jgi:hypothetical protein|nr:dependent oxidoreductase [Conexibacter sp.]
MNERQAEIIIVGGGTGGCAAAMAAARLGRRVVMTEATDWIGGQMTSQAVPPDEHPWIEDFGCTRSWRRFRDGVRACFRDHFPLRGEAMVDERTHLGGALVTKVPCPPEVAFKIVEQLLLPDKIAGRIRQLTRTRPVAAEVEGDRVRSVTVEHLETGEQTVLHGAYFLDATDAGDVLALTGTEYVTGRESVDQTGEPHATADADPLDMQAITWCFALDHLPGEDHTIDRPEDYDFWRNFRPEFWPDRLLSWQAPDPVDPQRPRRMTLFDDGSADHPFPLWRYRRLIEREQFIPGTVDSDITLVNWPQNDYFLGPVIDVDADEADRHLRGARQLSLSLLYWMQTEAPRRDDGHGYPGLRLRGDLMGTSNGLAKAPYLRESRRIRARRTIVEQDLTPLTRPKGAVRYTDSVGVGAYRIDLHPSTGGRTYIDVPSWPFEIPLSALIPVRMENLLPAAKNIGTTHITTGCYRLHPVEWNIGEAAGFLAAHCLETGATPQQISDDGARTQAFQRLLDDHGIERHWPTLRPL